MILYPDAHLNNVREITTNFLQNNKINALILDVDNTLIDYDKNLPEETIEWAKELKNNNINYNNWKYKSDRDYSNFDFSKFYANNF